MVRCTMHLYYPPGWELGEGAAVDAEALALLGEEVAARCRQAAGILGVLLARGWTSKVGRYEVVAEKPCDRATAMLDFLRCGLDPVALGLEEPSRVSGQGPGPGPTVTLDLDNRAKGDGR